jgi:sulfur-carrier protein adenylyltransferase/sulfurtransferase
VIWYVENPLRYRREREALDALASSAEWLSLGEWRIDSALRLILDADIIVGERTFPVSLRYPNHFPHSPPPVLPRGESERWSSHQYGAGGELCLEFGPDNWHPDLTGADMIESAHRLLQGEQPVSGVRGRGAVRDATTRGRELRGQTMRLLTTPGLAGIMGSLRDKEVREGTVVVTFRERSVVYVVDSVVMPDGQKWVDPAIPAILAEEGVQRPIALLRWPPDLELPSIKSRTEFRSAVAACGIELPEANYAVLARGPDLHAYFLWEKDDSACCLSVIPPQPEVARLDENHAALRERRVGLVGCGSIGSKIAVMLARSGVGRFLLIDDDIMLPDNLVRHELDWREVGTHKVAAVARRINLVNPSAHCETREHRLGGQQSSGSVETLIESLAECDLIVDASADARVFNYLCAAVAVGKKPLVWTEAFGGGFGGLIARYRPGLEPDPATMRRTIENWCADQGKPIERAAEDYETRGSGPPLIADDADVSVIAAHAARLAIDTLTRDPSIFPNSVYLIGLAEGWIFDQPFDTRPIDVGAPSFGTTVEPVDERVAEEELARVGELFNKFADATASD